MVYRVSSIYPTPITTACQHSSGKIGRKLNC
jgi:hypothetical protein